VCVCVEVGSPGKCILSHNSWFSLKASSIIGSIIENCSSSRICASPTFFQTFSIPNAFMTQAPLNSSVSYYLIYGRVPCPLGNLSIDFH
jgi:hypothetical protein